jgi:phosphoglycolate phosphatase-like HAD superfamily hydrolase
MYVHALLFDLHHTLTEVKDSLYSLIIRMMRLNGIEVRDITTDDVASAFMVADAAVEEFQLQNNVGPHWGEDAEDWIPLVKIMFEALGLALPTDNIALRFEKDFKYETIESDWESFTNDARNAITTLNEMGYPMGICTRRNDSPLSLLDREGMSDCFKTVQWSGVVGYEKPSPFTLLEAARDLQVNPHHCMYVGNYVGADIEAALRCEMKPILLTWANPHEAEKAPEGTIVFNMPTDFVKWLQLQAASSTD